MTSERPVVAVISVRDLPGLHPARQLAEVVVVADPDRLADVAGRMEAAFAWANGRTRLLDLVPRAPRLRWIQSSSAGVEDLARPVLRERDIVLTNAAGIFDRGLAESVLGFLLAFSARILEDARAEPGDWSDDGVRLLTGSTALIVGAGSIGTETARLLRAAGLRVRGIARTPRPAGEVFEAIRGTRDLAEELAIADHVVNVLPDTPATRHLFDAAAFGSMKESALFVNIGRGSTVDEAALIEALDHGLIAGAALDVFEVEPLPPDHPLWRMPNVLISPHRAGDHEGGEADVVALFLDNLRRFVAREPLRNVVDHELGYVPAPRP